MPIHAFAALAQGAALTPHRYEPPALGPFDVELAISHCGICHSDIHLIDNDWATSQYPLVPGHEIVGMVRRAGPDVTGVSIGDRVGVGWQAGSCLACEWCERGEEHCCPKQVATCVGRPGGFAEAIRLDSRFVYPVPASLASENAAPLLCGGVTVYSPLARMTRPASRAGVIGIGGLGHLAVQFARAFGCEVTAFTTSPDKEAEARRLGARHFVVASDAGAMDRAAHSLDLLLSTVTVALDWPAWMKVLRPRGTLCFVGASPGTLGVATAALMIGEHTLAGSVIGSRAVTREMLEFAARHGIAARTEVVPMAQVNAAIERVRQNRARYRMVLTNG
ncbi:MAG: NAD(P)-dependent alcohol dehydrogenase [Acidobacteria bacterium]|nr:NAD(P)-dependent alcohol dehydrogenase [Acidobacteriota bacterium]